MKECVFCKIASGDIQKEFDYEDDDLMVFSDLKPLKPVHLLFVPKEHIKEFLHVNEHGLFAKIGKVIQKMIREKGLEDNGYRITVNGGGTQDVDHLHFHLIGPLNR